MIRGEPRHRPADWVTVSLCTSHFHKLSTSTSNYYLFSSKEPKFHKPHSKKKKNTEGRKPAVKWFFVATREWITNSGHSKKCPGCLVSWPASRCFPTTASIVCCRETVASSSSNTAAELCTSFAEVTLRQSGTAGNRLLKKKINKQKRHSTYTSVNSFRLVAGLKTSRRPITYGKGGGHENLRQGHRGNNSQQVSLSFSTHVFMFHVLEQPQLSVCPLGVDVRLKGPRQLLHSDLQAGLYVICRTVRRRGEIQESLNVRSNHIAVLHL